MAGKAPKSPEQVDQALEAYWAENPSEMYAAMLRDPDAFGLNKQSATDNQTLLRAKYETGQLSDPQAEQFLRVHGSRTGVDPSTLNAQENYWAYGTGVPDANGMGNDGGQRTPTNTGGSSGGPEWGGAGYTPPVTPPVAPPAPPASGGGATPPATPAAPPSGGPGASNGSLYGPPMPFGGYEGPNAELYAQQFGNLKAGGDAYQHQALAAALRREQQQGEQTNAAPWEANWDWANLPQVRTNAQQPGEAQPYSWTLNPAYNFSPGETSNADMIRAVMGNSGFSNSDRNWFNRAIEDSKMDQDFNWSQQRNPQDILSKFDYAGDNRDRMEKAINLAFAREDLSTPQGGGPAAPPPGYAAPR